MNGRKWEWSVVLCGLSCPFNSWSPAPHPFALLRPPPHTFFAPLIINSWVWFFWSLSLGLGLSLSYHTQANYGCWTPCSQRVMLGQITASFTTVPKTCAKAGGGVLRERQWLLQLDGERGRRPWRPPLWGRAWGKGLQSSGHLPAGAEHPGGSPGSQPSAWHFYTHRLLRPLGKHRGVRVTCQATSIREWKMGYKHNWKFRDHPARVGSGAGWGDGDAQPRGTVCGSLWEPPYLECWTWPLEACSSEILKRPGNTDGSSAHSGPPHHTVSVGAAQTMRPYTPVPPKSTPEAQLHSSLRIQPVEGHYIET
jgi:hypothetical protein